MKKIELNVTKLIEPLSIHDMKNVVGGADEYICLCTFYDQYDNKIGSSSTYGGVSGALDDISCDAQCVNYCSSGYNCHKYVVSFTYRREESHS